MTDAGAAAFTSLSDDELLDRFQRAAFGYFLEHANPDNGLVADTSRDGAPCSIAVVGFALSSYPIGVERGWITRDEAATRTVKALRFFCDSPQGRQEDATGHKGFFYHFLDMKSGRRAWRSELSSIDTTLLLAGALTARAYFDGDAAIEAEIRERAEAIYHRIDWRWALGGKATVRMGWKPKSGFLRTGWEGYSEATILYVLGLASPSHPLPPESFAAWAATYQWENIDGHHLLYAGPLFIHHYSHAWIDFDGIRDRAMREKDSDYFENSRRAALVQRAYARRNPKNFAGYHEDCWGLSASDGPGPRVVTLRGQRRRFRGYAARGAPFGPDDGAISPSAALASLPFAPDHVMRALRRLCGLYPEVARDGRLPSAFNPSLPGAGPAGWVSDGAFGLDQGIVVLMIENFRSGLIWKLMRRSPPIVEGLRRAGFEGGWLAL